MIDWLARVFLLNGHEKKIEDDDPAVECRPSLLPELRELTEKLTGTEPEGELPEEIKEWVEKKNGD